MLYLDIAVNVPINQTFTYTDIPSGKVSRNISIQAELIPTKRDRKVDSFEASIGKRVEIRFGNRQTIGYIVGIHDELPTNVPVEKGKIKSVVRVLDEEPLFNKETIEIAKWLSSFYVCSIGEALCTIIPSSKRESSLGGFAFEDSMNETKAVQLSDEQKNAIEGILQSSSKKQQFHYLYGNTGSGKTEVFLQAAEKILSEGKGVIYLVPEIGLTTQVMKAVVARFGKTAAVLHSELTASQRLTQWRRILNKEARVVVGARSAVFAPVPDLGMIIIDEEHDSSYKSGNTPRYHARQVAMYRCSKASIPLVMGSATPSVEAWQAMKTNSFIMHRLTKRLSGGKVPEIECIDLSKLPSGNGSISEKLENEIRQTIAEKKQTILFLNRRGFNHFFRCASCGFELKCKNCSVPMTYHKSINRLRCHYCGWSTEVPSSCPQCGSLDVGYSGFGTEFIETEVRSKFPNARIIRVDTDSLTKKGELEEKLTGFRNGEYDIMLGTQMIAKGLNFQNLKLVGVVLADTSLHLPDFRAAEKTFSLITQVAGRAGRFFPDGKVLVQTYNPLSPAIYYAVHGKYEEFYKSEIDQRMLLGFPPFSRLLRLVFRSAEEKLSVECSEQATKILEEKLGEYKKKYPEASQDTQIMGSSECPLSKISGYYRYQILIRGKNVGVLQKLASFLLYGFKKIDNVYIEVDVDPVSLL